MSDLTIRPLMPSEYAEAVALWHEVGLTRPWNDPGADLQRAADGPSSAVLGAFDNGSSRLVPRI